MTSQDQQVAAGAIVEDGTWLERLHGELRGLLAPVFAQARSRLTAFSYVRALLAEPGDRSSCWQLAEAAGHVTPRRMQALLAGQFDDPLALRDHHRGLPLRSRASQPRVSARRSGRWPMTAPWCSKEGGRALFPARWLSAGWPLTAYRTHDGTRKAA